MSACSPGLFHTPDSTNYAPVNTACDMEVSSPTLNPAVLRSLVHCMNSYGALAPVEQLMSRLSDAEMQPVADAMSAYLFKQPTTLYELDSTLQTMDAAGKLDTVYGGIGRVLKNDEFVVAALKLLKDSYYESTSMPASWFRAPPADPRILAAAKYLSQRLTSANVATGIDVGMTLANAPAFQSLQRHFRGQSPNGSSLQDLTDATLEYAQDTTVPVGRMALEGLIRQDLFLAIDDSIGGATTEAIQNGTDRFSSVLRETLSGDGRIFDGITSLHNALHRPLYCLKGTQKIPDGAMFIMSEIARQNSSDVAQYLRVTNPLIVISVNPMCDYPPQLATYYPSIVQLAQSSAIEPAADMMKAFYRSEIHDSVNGKDRPMADLLIGMLADGSIKKMIPVLTELTGREAWDDLLLLAALPRVEDRDSISDALSFIRDPIPEIGDGTSVYDLLVDSLHRISPADFFRFVSSLRKFTDSDDPALLPLLQSLRDLYYVNDVHPVADLARNFMNDAPARAALFETVFKTVDMAELQDSVKLMSTMAGDGRLKEIVNTVLTIFRRYSAQGTVPIHPATQPAFAAKSRHSFDERDLKPFPVLVTQPDPADPCSHLDLTFGVDQFADPNYDKKLGDMVNCLSRTTQDPSIAEDVQYLRSQVSGINGWDFFRLPIEIVKGFDPSAQELTYLSGAWLRSFDSGYFLNLLDTVPYFVDQSVAPSPGGAPFDAGPVLRPLLDLASPLVSGDSKAKFDTIEKFAAGVLKREDFPKTLETAHKLYRQQLEPTYTPIVTQVDGERIMRWVNNKECERPDAGNLELRATQIIDDFDNSIDNWSLANGQPKRNYTFEQLKGYLEPTIRKIADPTLDDPDESLLQAFLNIMRDFTLEPGQAPDQNRHFSPDDILQWIKDRSEDYRLITFYYKDEHGNFEDQPRARLVNTLDLLELVQIEADFQVDILGIELVGNSSLQYTAEFAEAWGDDPRELWPERIQKLYPPGTPIKRIKDVIDEMYKAQAMFADLVGYPTFPHCRQLSDPNDPPEVQKAETTWPSNKTGAQFPEIGMFRNLQRSLFNMNQVLEVLYENRPFDPGEDPGHHPNPAHAGGMKVLRTVMYELYFSTPREFRNYKLPQSQEWRNNLKISDDLSRIGTFRLLGQKLREFKGDERQLRDAFRNFFMSVKLPETTEAMTALFPKKNQDVFWAALKRVFAVLDSAEGIYTDAQKQQLASMSATDAQSQKDQWVRDAGRMKQLGLYSLAAGGDLNLTQSMMGAMAIALKEFPDYLTAHSDKIESLLRSERTSYFMRALYEDPEPTEQERVARVVRSAMSNGDVVRGMLGLLEAIDKDPAASSSWSLFSNRYDALMALPQFQPYRQYFDRFQDDMIWFFSNQSTDPNAILASDHMRMYTAQLLEQGDIDQFLILAKTDPNKFYQVLQTISRYVENGELQDFFNLVRRSLSDPS